MKAIALAVSARKHGNCCDFAQFMLEHLNAEGIETELINFYDYNITPCQGCEYECIQRVDPQKRVCPIQDDVRLIWEKIWQSEILFLFVPIMAACRPHCG